MQEHECCWHTTDEGEWCCICEGYMLTNQEAIAIIKDITYKPGVTFTAEPDPSMFWQTPQGDPMLRLRIEMQVPDVNDSETTVPVESWILLDGLALDSEQNLLEHVFYQLRKMEDHELKEWCTILTLS